MSVRNGNNLRSNIDNNSHVSREREWERYKEKEGEVYYVAGGGLI